jgi:hypothetical protein
MATPPPIQSTFIHAAVYSDLFLHMASQIFPDVAYLALSDDQRRVAQNETDNLLLRSKLRMESRMFSTNFAFQNPDQSQVTPADTVWGAPLEVPKADAKAPGQYV